MGEIWDREKVIGRITSFSRFYFQSTGNFALLSSISTIFRSLVCLFVCLCGALPSAINLEAHPLLLAEALAWRERESPPGMWANHQADWWSASEGHVLHTPLPDGTATEAVSGLAARLLFLAQEHHISCASSFNSSPRMLCYFYSKVFFYLFFLQSAAWMSLWKWNSNEFHWQMKRLCSKFLGFSACALQLLSTKRCLYCRRISIAMMNAVLGQKNL